MVSILQGWVRAEKRKQEMVGLSHYRLLYIAVMLVTKTTTETFCESLNISFAATRIVACEYL